MKLMGIGRWLVEISSQSSTMMRKTCFSGAGTVAEFLFVFSWLFLPFFKSIFCRQNNELRYFLLFLWPKNWKIVHKFHTILRKIVGVRNFKPSDLATLTMHSQN